MTKKMTRLSLIALLISVFGLTNLFSQVSLTNASNSTLINFSNSTPTTVGSTPGSAYTGTGFSPNPTTAGRLNSNAWAVTGWSDGALAFAGTNTAGDYARGAVSAAQTTGGMYAFTGAPGSVSNPALMIQPGGSDFAPGTLTLKIVNSGTTAINSFTISYDLFIRNDQLRSNSFNFSYSLNNSAYTSVSALDYTSTAASDALGWVKVSTSPSRSTVINSLNIAPGAFFYIRWSSDDVGGSGSRDEFGLDDISINANFVVPTPSLSVSNNGTQPTAAAIFQNSNNNILQQFIVTEGNVAAATLNTITIPLAGTYSASDINTMGLKLYGNTTNSFASATLLSSKASASAGSGETVTFGSLAYAIPQNTARYFWITSDISASAVIGKTINASALTTGNFAFAAGSVTGSVNAGGIQTITAAIVTTQLRTSYCGYTAQSFGEFIGADSVLTANYYRFQLVNAANSYTQTFTNSSGYPYLALYLFPGMSYSTTYTVTVAWSADGVTFSPYGTPCTVTSPAAEYTQLVAGSCGATYTGWNNLISADAVSGATNYRFQLTNAALSYTQTFTNTHQNFNFSSYTGLQASTPYTVSVAVELLGTWNPYGTACTVTTPAAPTTSMMPMYCGYTPSSYNELMTAEVQSGSSYMFKLENTALGYSQTFTNVNRNVNLVQYTGLTAGTTYSISVSVFYNGAYGPYGNVCQITVPSSAPTTSVVPANCGYTPATYHELMNVTSLAGVTNYEYKLENASLGYSQTFTNVHQNFNFAVYTGLTTSTTYTISARVYFMGAWGAYGPTCTVTTPASSAIMLTSNGNTSTINGSNKRISTTENNDNSFDAMAYPNPFNDQFAINLLSYTVNEAVTIRVFDATGKLMEEHQVSPETIKDLNIGSNYAQGLYNIVISQGAQSKSIKVIRS